MPIKAPAVTARTVLSLEGRTPGDQPVVVLDTSSPIPDVDHVLATIFQAPLSHDNSPGCAHTAAGNTNHPVGSSNPTSISSSGTFDQSVPVYSIHGPVQSFPCFNEAAATDHASAYSSYGLSSVVSAMCATGLQQGINIPGLMMHGTTSTSPPHGYEQSQYQNPLGLNDIGIDMQQTLYYSPHPPHMGTSSVSFDQAAPVHTHGGPAEWLRGPDFGSFNKASTAKNTTQFPHDIDTRLLASDPKLHGALASHERSQYHKAPAVDNTWFNALQSSHTSGPGTAMELNEPQSFAGSGRSSEHVDSGYNFEVTPFYGAPPATVAAPIRTFQASGSSATACIATQSPLESQLRQGTKRRVVIYDDCIFCKEEIACTPRNGAFSPRGDTFLAHYTGRGRRQCAVWNKLRVHCAQGGKGIVNIDRLGERILAIYPSLAPEFRHRQLGRRVKASLVEWWSQLSDEQQGELLKSGHGSKRSGGKA